MRLQSGIKLTDYVITFPIQPEVDKFKGFDLTPGKTAKVSASLISECHASFECQLYDDAMIDRYNMFIFEVVKAHVAPSPDKEESLHYQGTGQCMLSVRSIVRKDLFKSSMLN